MSAAIYKQGQGYWVRVLTAILAGAIVLAAAAWAFGQAAALRLPQPTQRVGLAAVRGDAPQPGAVVEVFETLNAERSRTGSAVVESFAPQGTGSAELIVRDVAMDSGGLLIPSGAVIEQAQGLTGAGQGVRAEVVSAVGIDVIERIYIQAGIAGVILLSGAVVIYAFVGVRRSAVDFLIATDGEMKKVNWSTRKEVQGSTAVVVIATFLLATGIFFVDSGFSAFFRMINVLQ
ncbi:MAG: preprotein translocase subunit SecE [Planctomycetota bacterium]